MREAHDEHKEELLGFTVSGCVFDVIPIFSISRCLLFKSTQLNPQCTICTQYEAVKPFARTS
jgi:hypothetical protein